MPYISTFEGRHTRLRSVVAAVVPASMIAAAFGVACLGAYAIVFEGLMTAEGAAALLGALVMAGTFLVVGWVAAIFVVAFYLVVFGMPVALLLGDRIRHPLALAIALVDAVVSAMLVVGGSALNLFEGDGFHLPTFGIVLCFALPAGYFYRRSVIALRDESGLTG